MLLRDSKVFMTHSPQFFFFFSISSKKEGQQTLNISELDSKCPSSTLEKEIR